MRTDDLIARLAAGENEPPLRPRPRWLEATLIALGLSLVMMIASIGPRPDLGAAVWVVLAKAAFAAAFATLAIGLSVRLAKPGRPARRPMLGLGALLVASAVAAAVAFFGADPGERWQAWTGGGFPWCLVFIPVLGVPAAIALGFVVRRLAPTRLAVTGAAIGAASGGIGAIVYAMHCPVDSMAFVATWYALAIAICAALGALLGERLLRW